MSERGALHSIPKMADNVGFTGASKNMCVRPMESGCKGMGRRINLKNISRFPPSVVFMAGVAIFILAGAGTTRAQDSDLTRKLTLKEAVNLAVANSRDLALARLQYGVMQRQIGVARSAFLPNIYTGTGVAYTSGFPLLEGGGAPAIFTLSYAQQIFNPPLKGEQRAAEQRAEEQRLSMDGVRDTVMSRAALDYLELAKVRHALELMHGERTSAGRILEATRERADTGRELPIEVIRAQLTTARIEQRIAQMEDREFARGWIAAQHDSVVRPRQTRDLQLEVILIRPEPRHFAVGPGPAQHGKRRMLGLVDGVLNAFQPDLETFAAVMPGAVAGGKNCRV